MFPFFFLLPVYRLLLGSLAALFPFFASMCQTKPYVSIQSGVWERDLRKNPLCYKTDREFLFFYRLWPWYKNPKVIKPAFPQSCKPDLRTHWNVSQSHRTMSIFENGLLWSVWETASVFGHWVEHFWKACVIHAAQQGLRYFTKGQQMASAFYEQLSYQWELICLDVCWSLNEHRPTHWNDDSVIQIAFNQKRLTEELGIKAIAEIDGNCCVKSCFLSSFYKCFGVEPLQINKRFIYTTIRVSLFWPELDASWFARVILFNLNTDSTPFQVLSLP